MGSIFEIRRRHLEGVFALMYSRIVAKNIGGWERCPQKYFPGAGYLLVPETEKRKSLDFGTFRKKWARIGKKLTKIRFFVFSGQSLALSKTSVHVYVVNVSPYTFDSKQSDWARKKAKNAYFSNQIVVGRRLHVIKNNFVVHN